MKRQPPRLPPAALANNNVCLKPPKELQGLSLGEQMFIARGFPLRRLRQLTHSGDPAARQAGLFGTASAIAFPQNGITVLRALPTTPEHVAEYLSIFFTNLLHSDLRFCREFIVRRAVVHRALSWLVLHNPFYCDLSIDLEALQQLPEDGVPEAWLQQAQRTDVALQREVGPADATEEGSSTLGSVNAAVLEPGTDSIDPIQLWNTALLACERFDRTASTDYEAATAHFRLAQEAMQRLGHSARHPALQAAEEHPTKVYAFLPHADQPLDSYHPSFWSLCFPCLFPYGDGIDGQYRTSFLSDHAWAAHLLLRRDRAPEMHWRLDLDFVAVLFSVLHRRRLLRAVRVKIASPSFQAAVPSFCNLHAVDFAAVAATLGEPFGCCLVFFFLPSFFVSFRTFWKWFILTCAGRATHCPSSQERLYPRGAAFQ